MYKLTNDNSIIRLTDNAAIPNSPGNRDWEQYQQWLAAGNKPQIANAEVTPSPNWNGMLNAVRGSEIFGKTYTLSKSDAAINAAFTLVLTTLTSSNPNLNDYIFGLTELQNTMKSNMTQADVDTINTMLKKNNFDFALKYVTQPISTSTIATKLL